MQKKIALATSLNLGAWILAMVVIVILVVVAPVTLLNLLDGDFSLFFLFIGLVVSFVTPFGLVMTMFIQLTQRLYGLSPDDAAGLVRRIVWGLPIRPPVGPIQRVQDGRALPEGPDVIQQAGGPAFLSIGHDSAVVTSRAGQLSRVLGPGFHRLQSFERLWDVVDLRPQRRKVHVEAMTRDGIPIHCDAEIRFRIRPGDQAPSDKVPYPFSDDAVLHLTTMVKRNKGGGVFQFWPTRVAGGALDGEIRNRLELYSLDEYLATDQTDTPLIAQLEREILEAMQKSAPGMGIEVEEVRLGPVLPAEEDISLQWLEAWQSEWQRRAADIIIEGEADRKRLVEIETVKAQVGLVSHMLASLEQIDIEKQEIDPQLVMLHFLEVVRSMADQTSSHEMYREAESLRRLLYMVNPQSSQQSNTRWPQPGSPPPKDPPALPPS